MSETKAVPAPFSVESLAQVKNIKAETVLGMMGVLPGNEAFDYIPAENAATPYDSALTALRELRGLAGLNMPAESQERRALNQMFTEQVIQPAVQREMLGNLRTQIKDELANQQKHSQALQGRIAETPGFWGAVIRLRFAERNAKRDLQTQLAATTDQISQITTGAAQIDAAYNEAEGTLKQGAQKAVEYLISLTEDRARDQFGHGREAYVQAASLRDRLAKGEVPEAERAAAEADLRYLDKKVERAVKKGHDLGYAFDFAAADETQQMQPRTASNDPADRNARQYYLDNAEMIQKIIVNHPDVFTSAPESLGQLVAATHYLQSAPDAQGKTTPLDATQVEEIFAVAHAIKNATLLRQMGNTEEAIDPKRTAPHPYGHDVSDQVAQVVALMTAIGLDHMGSREGLAEDAARLSTLSYQLAARKIMDGPLKDDPRMQNVAQGIADLSALPTREELQNQLRSTVSVIASSYVQNLLQGTLTAEQPNLTAEQVAAAITTLGGEKAAAIHQVLEIAADALAGGMAETEQKAQSRDNILSIVAISANSQIAQAQARKAQENIAAAAPAKDENPVVRQPADTPAVTAVPVAVQDTPVEAGMTQSQASPTLNDLQPAVINPAPVGQAGDGAALRVTPTPLLSRVPTPAGSHQDQVEQEPAAAAVPVR